MQARIRLFARVRELLQTDVVELDLPSGATVGDLRQGLAQEYPALRGLLARSALAVNDEFADDALTLPVAAEIALLPPVSGG